MFAAGPAAIAATRFHVGSPPVGVHSECVIEVVERSLYRGVDVRRHGVLRGELAHDADRVAGGVVVALGESAAQARRRPLEPRRLRENAPKPHVDVPGRGTVHPGDLHEAAERDRADAVLDPVVRALHDCGREPDVEPPRPHSEDERDDEVTELVDQDQQAEADDRDEDGHAGCSPRVASRRASASAATRSSRSRAAAPSTRDSVSSTTAPMSRKAIRPSRKAATATSFAAL